MKKKLFFIPYSRVQNGRAPFLALTYITRELAEFLLNDNPFYLYLIQDKVKNAENHEQIISDIWTCFEDKETVLVFIDMKHKKVEEIFSSLQTQKEFIDIEMCSFSAIKFLVDIARIWILQLEKQKKKESYYFNPCEDLLDEDKEILKMTLN